MMNAKVVEKVARAIRRAKLLDITPRLPRKMIDTVVDTYWVHDRKQARAAITAYEKHRSQA